ncbi:MAG: YgjV family protein [Rouxiella aceris]|uniref:YgjV family protein n=1 Tax=Rouxiella aceris TaxID=2703884 RepID=UPI00284C8AEF|nr:YgjV family protein [Rouxiella aceris]MDR3430784.1 YgjV family protein [Rouxiella aceris]
MTFYWFAQAVGLLAFFVGITMFFNRSDRRFKQQLSAYSAIIGIHFLLMGANPAGMSALLNSVRTLLALRTRSQWVMAVFIALTLIFGLGKAKHLMELLPVIGTVVSTWALFRTSGLKTRCIMWCSTCGWVAHNIWLGSIGGSLIEGSFLIMNGYNIIRFYRLQRQGIDPFEVEKQLEKKEAQEKTA